MQFTNLYIIINILYLVINKNLCIALYKLINIYNWKKKKNLFQIGWMKIIVGYYVIYTAPSFPSNIKDTTLLITNNNKFFFYFYIFYKDW